MRLYGAIHTTFWQQPNIQHLSDPAKLLSVYLLTCSHSNMLGCFRLPTGYAMEDLRWNTAKTIHAFDELERASFLTRDPVSHWLVIHDFLQWNPIHNSKQAAGVERLFYLVATESRVSIPLARGMLRYGKHLSEPLLEIIKGIDTHLFPGCTDKDKDKDPNTDKNKKRIMSSTLVDNSHSLKESTLEILTFLNEKTNRAYRPVETNLKLIMARLQSGATLQDCFQVIAKKTREWQGDSKMAEYLRPATLFNAIKFEQYLGELGEDKSFTQEAQHHE